MTARRKDGEQQQKNAAVSITFRSLDCIFTAAESSAKAKRALGAFNAISNKLSLSISINTKYLCRVNVHNGPQLSIGKRKCAHHLMVRLLCAAERSPVSLTLTLRPQNNTLTLYAVNAMEINSLGPEIGRRHLWKNSLTYFHAFVALSRKSESMRGENIGLLLIKFAENAFHHFRSLAICIIPNSPFAVHVGVPNARHSELRPTEESREPPNAAANIKARRASERENYYVFALNFSLRYSGKVKTLFSVKPKLCLFIRNRFSRVCDILRHANYFNQCKTFRKFPIIADITFPRLPFLSLSNSFRLSTCAAQKIPASRGHEDSLSRSVIYSKVSHRYGAASARARIRTLLGRANDEFRAAEVCICINHISDFGSECISARDSFHL